MTLIITCWPPPPRLPTGYYAFADLDSECHYTVTATQPSGYADGLATAGTAGGVVSDNSISGDHN